MMRGVFVAIAVLCFVLLSSCVESSDMWSKEKLRVYQTSLIPWMEANAVTTRIDRYYDIPDADLAETFREYALRGLTDWNDVADVAGISTVVNNSKFLYPYLMRRKPDGIGVIGGLKTSLLPGGTKDSTDPYDFTNVAGWQRIADESVYIAEVTGQKVIVLDSESSLWRFNVGEADIDLSKLNDAMSPLRATGLTFWWHVPDILSNTPRFPDREDKTTALTMALMKALPNGVIMHSHGWYDKRSDADHLRRETKLRKLVGDKRIVPMIWTIPDGIWRWRDSTHTKRCFTPSETLSEIRGMRNRYPGVIIYPGGMNWTPRVPEMFAALRR